jgi:hypothetical protein
MPNKESFKEKIQKKRTLMKDYVRNAFRTGKTKVMNGLRWIKENPQETAIIASAAAGASSILKKGLRYITQRRVTYNKRRFIYDRSLNAYCQTTRTLKEADIAKINHLKRTYGLKTSEALERLGLLK